jgi:hypothetical protein
MTTLNRFQAAALLGIGERTLRRRVEKGLIQCTRVGKGDFAEVSFTYEQLGLPEPAPCESHPLHDVVDEVSLHRVAKLEIEPELKPVFAPHPASPIDLKAEEDFRFSQAYLAGEVTDSAGNNVNGTNERFPTKGHVSLLGPREPQRLKRLSTTSHMQPGLVGTSRTMGGVDGEPVAHAGSNNHPLNGAFRTDAYKKHPEAQQDSKIFVDRAVFTAALRKGFVR